MVPLHTPSPHTKPSLFRRRRRTFLFSGVTLVLVVAVAVVWVFSSSGSSSSSSSEASSLTTDTNTTTPSKPTVKRRPAIVVLGDSCTQYGGGPQGWEVLLHDVYVRNVDTFNRGLSGYNTRIFLEHAMPGILEEVTNYYNAAAILIWFGVNDATLLDGPNHAQHIPLSEYKQNLIKMIQQLRDATPHTKILLLSPAYVDEKQRLASMMKSGRNETDPLDRTNAETAKYAKACGEIMNETFRSDANVGYIDMYDHFVRTYPSDANRTNILRDGLHFTPVGDHIFYDLVKYKIETMMSDKDALSTPQFPADTTYITY